MEYSYDEIAKAKTLADEKIDKIEKIKQNPNKHSQKDKQSFANSIKDSNKVNSNDTTRNK